MSKILFSIGNVALYSSALSSTIYYRENNNWGIEQFASLGLFWIGFMLPTGIMWGQINRTIISALRLPSKYKTGSNVLQLNYYQNKKALFSDIILNQGMYSLITIFGLYSYFNDVKPEVFNSQQALEVKGEEEGEQQLTNNSEQEKGGILSEQTQEKDSTAQIIYQNGLSLLQTRIRLSLVSTLWDIWYPQFILRKQQMDTLYLAKGALRIHKFKEIMFLMVWQHCIISTYNDYQQSKLKKKNSNENNNTNNTNTQ